MSASTTDAVAAAGLVATGGALGHALRFSRAMRAGVVFVNAATVEAETHLPFGTGLEPVASGQLAP